MSKLIHPMFARQLSSSGFFLVPRGHPAVCRASSSYLPHIPPHPLWPVQGFPPWPPQVPHPHPEVRQVFSGRTVHPWNINPVNFTGLRSFNTSAGPRMERPNRDREPPHKRRKSAEDKRSIEAGEGHRGGAAGVTGAKNEDSESEHHLPDSSSDICPGPKHSFKDGGLGNNESGKGISKENSIDKDVKRTRAEDTDRHRKHSTNHDETPNRERIIHYQGGHEDSQPGRSRTQTTISKPEQDRVPVLKPNPWFKDRGSEVQGGQLRDRSSGGHPQMGLPFRPCCSTLTQDPWQLTGANMPPPPPGNFVPISQWEDVKPLKFLQRRWETPACITGIQTPENSTAFDFSVMSYNILSQQLLQENAYLYQYCHPDVLHWNHRLPNLLAEIQHLNADIVCLQEVQEDHYVNQIKPALQAIGYHCEYKKRTGRKPDGCAVIFKSSRLSLLSSNPIEFFRPGDDLLDRDNVGLVVLLQPKNTPIQSDPSAFICVANTHLLYNPRRGDIKLAQLAILLAEISRLSRLPDGTTSPVVLCGDLNSTPWSPLYSFLTTGFLNYKGLQISMVSGQENRPRGRLLTSPIWSHSLGIDYKCRYKNKPTAESSSSCPSAVEGAISNLKVEDAATNAAAAAATFKKARIEHSLKLLSSYQHHTMPDGRPEITTCHSHTATTVDYILYTPEFITRPSLPGGRGLQLLNRLSLVGHSELAEVNGLPNIYHSSDHLPLLVRFRLRC